MFSIVNPNLTIIKPVVIRSLCSFAIAVGLVQPEITKAAKNAKTVFFIMEALSSLSLRMRHVAKNESI